MSRARWIKLYSGIKDSAVWSDPVRLKAWVDILLSANYKDKEWFKNGQVIRIKRGQFVTSIRRLAESWRVSPGTARRILDQFAELHMIRRDSGTGKYTLITVIKYGDFQDCNLPDGYTDGYTDEHTDRYIDEHTDEHTDGIQHKNNKNIQKEKNKEEPDAPEGAPDDPWAWGGQKPTRWNEDDEWSWQNDQSNPNNPRMTRMEIWKFWGESDE